MSNQQNTFGLTVKKTPSGGASIQEVITVPKTPYFAAPNALVHPTKREVVVHKSIKNMTADELAAMGFQPGKLFLPSFTPKEKKEKKEKVAKAEKVAKEKVVKAKSEKTAIPSDPFMGVKFTEAHILSDAEFIKYTRAPFNIHSKGAKALFFANGGAAYLGHDCLQGSFEAMRGNILAKIAGLTAGEPYKRIQRLEGEHVVFNAGTYEQAIRIRETARRLAQIKADNYKWMGEPIRKVG